MDLKKIKKRLLNKIVKIIFDQKELRLSSLGHRIIKLSRKTKDRIISVWLGVTVIASLGLTFGSAHYLVKHNFCYDSPSRYDLIDCPWKYYPLDLLLVEIGPFIFMGVSVWYLIFRLGAFFRERSKFEIKNQSDFEDRAEEYYRELNSQRAKEKDFE